MYKTHFRPKDIQTERDEERYSCKWKNKIKQNETKKAGVAILVSDKTNFKTQTVTGDKEGHYTMNGDQSNERIQQL